MFSWDRNPNRPADYDDLCDKGGITLGPLLQTSRQKTPRLAETTFSRARTKKTTKNQSETTFEPQNTRLKNQGVA